MTGPIRITSPVIISRRAPDIKKKLIFYFVKCKLFDNFSETKTNTMDYKIVTSTYPEGLVSKVKSLMEDGWKPMGGHSVVGTFFQNRYTGSQHHSTSVETEYSQTMIKEEP